MTNASETPAVPRVLSLGSINADFQVRTERRPQPSETLIASDFLRLGGGKAANVAFLACKLDVPASLFGHVGDDDLAEQALAPLRAIGVDLAGVRRIGGAHTGMAMITVPPDGKKGIVLAPNANDAWGEPDAAEVERAVREAAPGSVLVADCEVPGFVVERALRAARQRGITTILDPSPAERVSDALLRLADVVSPNAGEAGALTGIDCGDTAAARKAGERLRERGAGIACVKLPDGGCVLVGEALFACVAAVPVDVCDSTGAGDAFAGALAVACLERRSWGEALRFAVAASHVAVTGYGSQPAFPDRAALKRMEQRLRVQSDGD